MKMKYDKHVGSTREPVDLLLFSEARNFSRLRIQLGTERCEKIVNLFQFNSALAVKLEGPKILKLPEYLKPSSFAEV